MAYDDQPETAYKKEVNGETICGNCREPISPQASTCPHCRAHLSNGNGGAMLFIVVGLLLTGTGLMLTKNMVTGEIAVTFETISKTVAVTGFGLLLLRWMYRDEIKGNV